MRCEYTIQNSTQSANLAQASNSINPNVFEDMPGKGTSATTYISTLTLRWLVITMSDVGVDDSHVIRQQLHHGPCIVQHVNLKHELESAATSED